MIDDGLRVGRGGSICFHLSVVARLLGERDLLTPFPGEKAQFLCLALSF
jgi:hypothetical protein